MPASRRIPYQQLTIEYRVRGALDGQTPAPVVNLTDPNAPGFVIPDRRGIRVVEVDGDLGLIDPDLNGGATQGDRCLPSVYLDTDGVAGDPLIAQFAVLDNVPEEGIMTPRGQVAPRFATGGLSVFFSDSPTEIPQGSVLGIAGYPSGGREKIVRVQIAVPDDALEWSEIQQACCCSNFPCEAPPLIETITPDTGQTATVQTFDVTGTGLGEGTDAAFNPLTYYFVPTDPESGASPVPATPTGPATLTATTLEATFVEPGEYYLVGTQPTNPECNNAGNPEQDPGNATVVIVVVCPEGVGATGDTGPTQGSLNNVVNVVGTDFGTAVSPNVVEVRIVNAANDELTVNSVTINGSTDLDVDFNADGPLGQYNIVLIPADQNNCEPSVITNAITVL